MTFKMRKYFVVYVFLVILFLKDSYACFQEDFVNDRSITTYSTFYEECCCTEPGYTVSNMRWMDPNNRVIGPGTDSNVYIEEQGDCLSLHIPSSSKTLSGKYKCVTNYKGVEYSQAHNLDVYDPLYLFNTSASQYLVHGKDSMIHCEAKGASPPRFKWSRGKDGQNELKDILKYQIIDGGVIIKNATDNDAGIYKCSVSVVSTGEEIEIDIDVKVMTVPTIKHLRASPEEVLAAGEPLIIECEAEGYPDPEYNWNKIIDLKPGNESKNTTWLQEDNTIRFESIEAEDAGVYECYVQNYVGNTNKIIEITVLVPPEILDFSNRTIVEGLEIAINCNATGIPTPNISITYEGKTFEEEKSTIYDHVINNLSILKVDKSKEGFYICNASNEVDYVTEFMYLTVLHPPRFDKPREIVWGWNGETIDLKCEPEASPPANITWRYSKDEMATTSESDINDILTNIVGRSRNYTFAITEDFAPYGVYKCIAKNELGESVLNIDMRKGYVPSPAVNVSVSEVSATSATFTITGDYNYIGPPVLGFKAEYDTVENYKVTHIHRNRTWAIDRPLKLGNLKPNVTYNIKFAAINRVGTGVWGEMISFITLEKSAPEPPILQVDPLEFSPSNVLKWQEPEDNGEPIDYYALRYCPVFEEIDETQCKEQRIEAATEQQLSDLQQNITYYFELIAHNAKGNSSTTNFSLIIPAALELPKSAPLLSGGVIIGISVVVVILCLLLLDLLLLFWKRQGMIAACCYKKSKKKPSPLHSRDKKGLLKDNGENTDDTLRRPNNGHREYEYNKTTGIITGKHSSV